MLIAVAGGGNSLCARRNVPRNFLEFSSSGHFGVVDPQLFPTGDWHDWGGEGGELAPGGRGSSNPCSHFQTKSEGGTSSPLRHDGIPHPMHGGIPHPMDGGWKSIPSELAGHTTTAAHQLRAPFVSSLLSDTEEGLRCRVSDSPVGLHVE